MITAVDELVRRDFPAIAGIPFEYRLASDVAIATPDLECWAGTMASAAPVRVGHLVGNCDTSAFSQVMEAAPWSTYYRDKAGEPAVVFHGYGSSIPSHVLRTISAGELYEVRYASRPEEPVPQRDKELAVLAMTLASRRRGILAHGCGFVLPNGRGALCLGISGAGKSTLARLLLRSGEHVRVMNDDRVIVTDEGETFRAWGSPWPGQGGIACAVDAPLAVLGFLRHGSSPEQRSISPREAARRLYQTLAMPLWSGAQTADALELVHRLATSLPLCEFTYPPTEEAAAWIVEQLMALVSE